MPMDLLTDEQWMKQALALARAGVGLTSPNPSVGCVLVDAQNQLVAEGFHQYALRDHAEVVALRQAGERARGATVYVTLEPCNHQGRTPPCTDALITACVGRVVVATLDANPMVRGQGVAKLRAAGIPVDVGMMQTEAQRLNDAFAKYIRTRQPFVTLKAAVSLDGRIAPAAQARGERAPYWLTGEEARIEVHRLRHEHDALLTGIGTILADNPLLTDRSGLPRRLPLLRAVLDTHLRMPLASKLFETAANGDLILFISKTAGKPTTDFTAHGVQIQPLQSHTTGLSLKEVFGALGEMGITSVLIEAGTRLNTAALAGGFVDRLVLFYAPRFLGEEGLPLIGSSHGMDILPSPEMDRFGDDLCLTSSIKNYWADEPAPKLYP